MTPTASEADRREAFKLYVKQRSIAGKGMFDDWSRNDAQDAFSHGYEAGRAALRAEDKADLTAAYMAGVERGKYIGRAALRAEMAAMPAVAWRGCLGGLYELKPEIRCTPLIPRPTISTESKCPYSIKGDDGTVKQCVERGHCGCSLGTESKEGDG